LRVTRQKAWLPGSFIW